MMANTNGVTFDEYIMGRTSEEYQRLRKQPLLWEPVTNRILEDIGVATGYNCLDVGCGPAEVSRIMGRMARPGGTITGIDTDAGLGQEAFGVLKDTIDCGFNFIEGNVEEIDTIEGHPFDVTFVRFVLIHLGDPLAAVKKIYSWTKPGGYIVVQEYDFISWEVYPEFDAWKEFKKVWYGVCEKAGRDTRIGLKLPSIFVDAGIGIPEGTDVVGRSGTLERAAPMILAGYKSVLPVALKMGLTTEARSQKFYEQMQNAPKENFYSALSPLLVSAWARKPL